MRLRRSTSLQRLALLLALAGVLLRGLIPAGFMPGAVVEADGGGVGLVLCSGGVLKAAPDGAGTPSRQTMAECVYAVAAAPGVLPSLPPTLPLRQLKIGERGLPDLVAIDDRRSELPPPARGPPRPS